MNDIRPNIEPKPVKKPDVPATKTIEIKLSVPVIRSHPIVRRATKLLRRLGPKRRRLLLVTVVSLVIIGVSLVSWSRQQEISAQKTDSSPQNPLDQLKRGTPNFSTLLPDGKSVDDLGGWTRVSPENRDPVFAYTDVIDAIPISVSQQPLPDSFKEDTDAAVRNLALSNNATKAIDIDGGSAYVGSSTKGPQSVIFRKGETLILIKASTLIEDAKWQKYIQSLS